MRTISLKEFYEKAKQDPDLNHKLAALSREYGEKLRALAAGAGYELEEALPLSDEEAGDAAGGTGQRWFYGEPQSDRPDLSAGTYGKFR